MVTKLIWAWSLTTVVATLCYLAGWACAAEPAVAPSPAAAFAQDASAPDRGSDSDKRAQSGWVLSHDAYRSQPKRGGLIGMLEPQVAKYRKTPRFSLLPCPQRSSCLRPDANEANHRNAIFGSTELTIADLPTPVDGISAYFRPLLKIHFGAYQLPIFLYAPNPH
jgi:hypothetical protein